MLQGPGRKIARQFNLTINLSISVSVGLDLWTDRTVVEQQLRAGRYDAMAAYLASRSEHGAVMMRHTCSFQVNLDLGERSVAEERWRLARSFASAVPPSTPQIATSRRGEAIGVGKLRGS
mgnify:CR=1 FL=1